MTKKSQITSGGAPLPGRPVKGSTTGRPIMALLDLLSRRWALRILWELRERPCGFREMQQRCEQLSPNTLSTRLQELKDAKIVENTESGLLTLTERARGLEPALIALHAWSDEWAESMRDTGGEKRR